MMLKQEQLVTLFFALVLGLVTVQPLAAQVDRRSEGQPAAARVDSEPADVPCAGVTIVAEDFENGLPNGWQVVDGDGLTPRSETGLLGGWQSRVDYRDTTNNVLVSPSWYDPVGTSNDWLITDQISLGDNPCFSWTAYSQDDGFLEEYEVYLSTTTADTQAFLNGTRIDTIPSELGDKTIRVLNLNSFANQNVFLAFRQTSSDKFVLALDDFKVANIEPTDIGVNSVTYGTPEPEDTLTFSIAVANFGTDTIRSFEVCYSIDNGAIFCALVDTLDLAPNQVLAVTHPTTFISDSTDTFYDFCAWTRLSQGDNDVSNDTLCEAVAVGTPVGIGRPNENTLSLLVYPNPSQDIFHLRSEGQREALLIEVYSLDGRLIERISGPKGQQEMDLDLSDQPRGMYLLRARTESGKTTSQRIRLD